MNTIEIITDSLLKLQANPVIGNPIMAPCGAYEYQPLTPLRAAFLKSVRSVSSTFAIIELLRQPYPIEVFTLIRCIRDCTEDIFFLLEKYPNSSEKVNKFLNEFAQSNLNENETDHQDRIIKKDILNAQARFFFKDIHQPGYQKFVDKLKKMYRAYSGYVHTNQHHVTEIFNGTEFKVQGFSNHGWLIRRNELLGTVLVDVMFGLIMIARTTKDTNVEDRLLKEIEKITAS